MNYEEEQELQEDCSDMEYLDDLEKELRRYTGASEKIRGVIKSLEIALAEYKNDLEDNEHSLQEMRVEISKVLVRLDR